MPFAVRSFSESIWADYLTMIRAEKGTATTRGGAALQTLDDLLWSITAKDRAAQKARLARDGAAADQEPARRSAWQ